MHPTRRNTFERRIQNIKALAPSQEKISQLPKPNLFNLPSSSAVKRLLRSSALKRRPLRVSTLLINSSGDHHARLGEYAAQLWKDKSMTDVMIVVQAQEFKAHKAVLACYSPYFTEVLNTPGFNDIHYIQIPSVTARAFEILLEYMYTGELKVTCQELSEVYRAARRLGVKGALERCIELLQVTHENFQNMVYLYVTASKLKLLDASIRGFRLMVLHFERLVTTKEFLDLEVHQIDDLFKTDEIGARSEIIVFMAALKWINYNYLEREEYITQVFQCIRFSLMTMEEILACYHPPILPGLMERPEIRKTLLNATCYISAKLLGQESLFSELESRPRTFLFGGEPMVLWDVSVFDPDKFEITRRNLAVVKIQARYRGYVTRKLLREQAIAFNKNATVIQSVWRGYCVRKNVQSSKKFMMRKGRSINNYLLRKDSRSGVLKAYAKRTFEPLDMEPQTEKHIVVYAMGAFDAEAGEDGVNSILTFDTRDKNWSYVTDCLAPRHDARLVFLDSFLYIVGGYNPLHRTQTGSMLPLRECHRYHPGTGEWRELPMMSEARSSHAAAAFNGQVLAIGGKDERNKVLSSIERYDFNVGKWKKFSPSLPEPRMAMGSAIYKGMLWIAGGITYEDKRICMMDTVWCLDNKTCRWTKKGNLPLALAFPTLVSDGEYLFCVGGATRPASYDREELESIDKVYMFEKGRWVEQMMAMPVPGHGVVACNAGKNLFFLGGFSSHGMSPMEALVCMDIEGEDTEVLSTPPREAAGFVVEAVISWQ